MTVTIRVGDCRDWLGRFIQGHRPSPTTEFKKGQHWRKPQPFWDRATLFNDYHIRGWSAREIADWYGCTENNILHWLHKHNIPTRTIAEARVVKHWGSPGEANAMYGKRGVEVPNWKGGCTPERRAFYSSQEWAMACRTVWKRDKAQCRRCSKTKTKMHIHHIVTFAVARLRADVDNLVLLCVKCHRFVHSKKNTQMEFIGREVGSNECQDICGGLSASATNTSA